MTAGHLEAMRTFSIVISSVTCKLRKQGEIRRARNKTHTKTDAQSTETYHGALGALVDEEHAALLKDTHGEAVGDTGELRLHLGNLRIARVFGHGNIEASQEVYQLAAALLAHQLVHCRDNDPGVDGLGVARHEQAHAPVLAIIDNQLGAAAHFEQRVQLHFFLGWRKHGATKSECRHSARQEHQTITRVSSRVLCVHEETTLNLSIQRNTSLVLAVVECLYRFPPQLRYII